MEKQTPIISKRQCEKLAGSVSLKERLKIESNGINHTFVMLPLNEYATKEGLECWIDGGIHNANLNNTLLEISSNKDLIASLRISGKSLKFAHFNLPKPIEKVRDVNPNYGYWTEKETNLYSYEGYSHLELTSRGLEVAIQRATFFDSFSKKNPKKIWHAMKKEKFPTFVVEEQFSCSIDRIVCATLYNGGERIITSLPWIMGEREHTFIVYRGNGDMEYDSNLLPYKIKESACATKNYIETFQQLTSDYVLRSLKESIKENS